MGQANSFWRVDECQVAERVTKRGVKGRREGHSTEGGLWIVDRGLSQAAQDPDADPLGRVAERDVSPQRRGVGGREMELEEGSPRSELEKTIFADTGNGYGSGKG